MAMSISSVHCNICKKRSYGDKSEIQCTNCQEWQHILCVKLTSPQNLYCRKSPEYYVCQACLVDIFPFQTICNAELKKIFHIHKKKLFKQLNILNNESSLDELIKTDSNYRSVEWLRNCLSNSKKQHGLSILHFNVRSLPKHKQTLEELMVELHNYPDILAISETKLNDEKIKTNCSKLPHYNFIFSNSSTNAGGAAIYVLNTLKYTRREDLEFKTDDSENIFIEINVTNRKAIVIGLVYRHPSSDFTAFQDKFTETLNKLNHSKLEYIISGDFNIDLFKVESNSKICNYLSAIYTEGCNSLINKPTRITETSATLLDHMYSNMTNQITNRGILRFDISDYLPTFCCLGFKSLTRHNKKLIRDMKHFDRENFLDDINNLVSQNNNCFVIGGNCNADTIFDEFLHDFSKAVNAHAPLRTQTRKELQLSNKPWINKVF